MGKAYKSVHYKNFILGQVYYEEHNPCWIFKRLNTFLDSDYLEVL